MSSAYSNSPVLRLPIADSPQRRRAVTFAVLVACAALWQIGARGYPLAALALAPAMAWLLHGLLRAPWQGAELHWRGGAWTLRRDAGCLRLQVEPGAVALPWVVLLPFRAASGDGARQYLWIFADAVPREQWRRLRVRVRLPDPGRVGR